VTASGLAAFRAQVDQVTALVAEGPGGGPLRSFTARLDVAVGRARVAQEAALELPVDEDDPEIVEWIFICEALESAMERAQAVVEDAWLSGNRD
jgi:hypothetical protein